LNEERIIKTLERFGFSNIDSRIYIFLAKHGPNTIKETVAEFDVDEKKVCRSFEELLNIGIIKASIEYPLDFIVVPFEELIDILIEVKKEKAKALQASKKELLSFWRSITKKNDVKN
jgi:sugar-specific transcriptional regulator TrmB